MIRGDICLAQVGSKRRPVVVLTRSEVLDVRRLVTVAEITTRVRNLQVEVPIDQAAGVDEPSVVNADGIHTLHLASLSPPIGALDGATMRRVCRAVEIALGCR